MSMMTRSQALSDLPSHCAALDSSSAVPMTSTGTISSSVAIRFSRMTGLSSTM
jgi:hypothetical protein